MAKVIFILHRRDGLTRDELSAQWGGEHHVSVVNQIPGLQKFAQNQVRSAPGEPVCSLSRNGR